MEISTTVVTIRFSVPLDFNPKTIMSNDSQKVESKNVTMDEETSIDIDIKSINGSDDEDNMSIVSVDSLICDGNGFIDVFDIGVLSSVNDEVKNIVSSVEVGEVSSNSVNDQTVHVALDRSVRASAPVKECVPLWGFISIIGRRPEMEDAFAIVPWFHEIPIKMLMADQLVDRLNPNLSCLPAHFFGVFDGHGGAQVADYCRKRMHLALIEEISEPIDDTINNSEADSKKQWERAFVNCFQKVDDEVRGNANNRSGVTSEPIAPETVGSTAVVAVVSSTSIAIANCGDSRAVLYRGKQCIPLSVDHKPDRPDEYARIEAAGGRVIQWNGYRVFGVLAMSRSIGDRYLKPSIIPEPEVTVVSRTREDDFLILATDGLWDVMSSEEACEIARKRILFWHKKNPSSSSSTSTPRGESEDPASQSAAEYLSKLALQKGSKDNITIVVVDLKSQRKVKVKTNNEGGN